MRALVLGGSGNVGRLVLQQLLERGIQVRALVRTPEAMPNTLSANPSLSIIKANLLDLSVDDLASHVKGCDAVICTLGHNMNYGRIPALGVWLNPRDLVVKATKMICDSINEVQPESPIRFILLNTVGVLNPDGSDKHVRGGAERGLVSLLTALLPPYTDSVRSAQYISTQVGAKSKFIEWCTVRPDGFIDGEISEYKVLDSVQHAFYTPDKITKANIAHFMCELVENPKTWEEWKFKMPVLIDTNQPSK
ncbi:hypothetical protein BGZ80_011714 [Entomortierella chlamydospora]|uniref:NAD(P)-binding domain-containing protein n=1 Tax=Entomortierella chlamydospora TaxID=101097 RepID=A0A9P6MTF5_9FUNG|nr:hypothetical protein BGZ79_010987 [Entomortierella chlamydospora]KAG0012460.1 hypothetical protein BGZ80_011714 [Entomortierella chlamydospora]